MRTQRGNPGRQERLCAPGPELTARTSFPAGGPGGSSLFGLFSENGPFYLTKELEIMARDTTWNSDYGMLFIDNPVGAGFSYTGTGQGQQRAAQPSQRRRRGRRIVAAG